MLYSCTTNKLIDCVIVCNAISGRDFRLFMHMRTVYKLLVVENKILCSHELFSSCFPNNPDLADPKSQHGVRSGRAITQSGFPSEFRHQAGALSRFE